MGQEINRVACKLARTPRYKKKKQKPNFFKKEITFSNSNEKKNCGALKLIRTPWYWEKKYKWRKEGKNIKKVDPKISRDASKLHGYLVQKNTIKEAQLKEKSWRGHPGSKKSARGKHFFK